MKILVAFLLAIASAVFVVAPLALLGGCSGSPRSSSSSTSPPSSDVSAATCAGYCGHLRALGCPGAGASHAGATCETRCTAMQASIAPMDLACRSSAASCGAIDACEAPR